MPQRYRLLYSPLAWLEYIRGLSARLVQEHLDWNYDSVAPHVRPEHTVLDIGAWDCLLAKELRDRTGCQVQAVDVVDKNRTDVPFRTFNGRDLPFGDDERFDRVTLLYVLHHSADDAALLREARRVLAPGGRVLVGEDMAENRRQRWATIAFHVWLLTFTFMGWKGKFRSIERWRERFAAAGLAIESVHELGHQGDRRWFPRNMMLVLRAADELLER